VVGGCRSGKSAYAQRMAESLPPRRLFVATGAATDDEMARRIASHQLARRDRGWETVEEPLDVAGVFGRQREHNVLVLDCVTLWVNNLMYAAGAQSHEIDEAEIAGRCREMLAAARAATGTVIFVTSEVGMGIVPENASARRFRDLLGRANQQIAHEADAVTLLCCGIPLQIKDKG